MSKKAVCLHALKDIKIVFSKEAFIIQQLGTRTIRKFGHHLQILYISKWMLLVKN